MRRTLAAAVILAAALPARAQDLPRVDEVVKKYLDAIGGKEAVKALKSMQVKGTFDAGGVKGDLEVFTARPNKHLFRLSLGGTVLQQAGFDGRVAWATDVMAGPVVKTGRELEEAREEADFDSELYEPGSYKAAAVVARGPFEGADCYKVKFDYPSGRTVTDFFDVKTGFLVGQEAGAAGGGAAQDVTITYADFKKFGKLTLATKITRKAGGQDLPFTITAVTFDNVDEKVFDLPAEINGLLKK